MKPPGPLLPPGTQIISYIRSDRDIREGDRIYVVKNQNRYFVRVDLVRPVRKVNSCGRMRTRRGNPYLILYCYIEGPTP